MPPFHTANDLQRMRGVVARLVEQHVAEAPADHDAEHAEEQQVFDVAPVQPRSANQGWRTRSAASQRNSPKATR